MQIPHSVLSEKRKVEDIDDLIFEGQEEETTHSEK